jgi:hypothetical protein
MRGAAQSRAASARTGPRTGSRSPQSRVPGLERRPGAQGSRGVGRRRGEHQLSPGRCCNLRPRLRTAAGREPASPPPRAPRRAPAARRELPGSSHRRGRLRASEFGCPTSAWLKNGPSCLSQIRPFHLQKGKDVRYLNELSAEQPPSSLTFKRSQTLLWSLGVGRLFSGSQKVVF